jgi:hypothetical protein
MKGQVSFTLFNDNKNIIVFLRFKFIAYMLSMGLLLNACAPYQNLPNTPVFSEQERSALLQILDIEVKKAQTAPINTRLVTGVFPCSLGKQLVVTKHPIKLDWFTIAVFENQPNRQDRKHLVTFQMAHTQSVTGAVRLEDKIAGGVLLQLSNKTMLLNRKKGKREADNCQNASQKRFTQALLEDPTMAPRILRIKMQ